MFYLIFGIIAVGFLVVGWVWRIRFRDLRRAVTATCAEIASLHEGVPCQVTGTAGAVQPSPFTGTPCAWYRVQATARTRKGKTVFLKEESTSPFPLQDRTGRLLIDPADAAVDAAVRTMDEERPDNGSLPGLPDGDVIRYRYQEWILPPGEPLYVLGSARGGTVGRTAEIGQYTISTRTRRAFGRRALLFTAVGYGGGAAMLLFIAAATVYDHLE